MHSFAHADALFTKHRVTTDGTRVNHISIALNERDIRTIVDVFGSNASYNVIRWKLMRTTFYVQHVSALLFNPIGINEYRRTHNRPR